MSNKAMVTYKENFIVRIKNLFKNLFVRKKSNNIQEIDNENIQELDKNKGDKFFDEIKVDAKEVDIVSKKDNFLKQIDGNYEALNMLSLERLKKLEEYYNGIINKNNEKIKNLQNAQ